MKDKISFLDLLIISVLTLGISFGIAIYPLCIFLIMIRLFRASKDTAGFFLLMFGGPLGGIIRLMYPSIPLYGTLLSLFGAFLLKGWLRTFLVERRFALKYITAVFVVFLISYIFAEHTNYANKKIFQIIYHGSLMLFGFYVYQESNKMVNGDLVYLLLLTSITYVIFLVNFYHFTPGSLLDYNWLRNSLNVQTYLDGSETVVGYQTVGMTALMGGAILASNKKIDLIPFIIYMGVSFQLIMMSGARQAILGFVIILFLRFAFFSKGNKKMMMLAAGTILAYGIFKIIVNSGSETLEQLEETGGNGRDLIMLLALRLIVENPLFGVGLGGFAIHAYHLEVAWPHNFILEIFCELGCIGGLILLIIVYSFIKRYKINLRFITANNCYYFLFAAALAIRMMVSSDLSESIELFSLLFATSSLSYNKKVTSHDSI